MQAKKILFPTDFSTSSDAGLREATALARESGALLLIVHVEEPPTAYGGGEMYYGVPDPNNEQIVAMLKAVTPNAPDVRYEHRLIVGDPAAEIVRLAEEEGVDLIVLGTHGRTGLRRLLMGSVAEAIVRRANCRVLTVKPPPEGAPDRP
ncbi:MAG: universal stress protein [Pirellulales bacterium]|nr:universal stress protein [Pirellulales bacterium]